MMDEYLITFDVEWASDTIISEVANYLIETKVKATWFITHDSPEVRKLFDDPDLFEIGLHPNFENESTQGKTPIEVLNYLTKIAPDAKSIRTHNLLQSMPLLKIMREQFNILYDVSILLPITPNINPHSIFFSKNSEIIRFPYFWGDNLEMNNPTPSFSFSDKKYHVEGIKIFSFHPIHIILNSCDVENYFKFKSQINITKCTIPELDRFINKSKPGAKTMFEDLVQFIKDNTDANGLTISELAEKWKSLNDID